MQLFLRPLRSLAAIILIDSRTCNGCTRSMCITPGLYIGYCTAIIFQVDKRFGAAKQQFIGGKGSSDNMRLTDAGHLIRVFEIFYQFREYQSILLSTEQLIKIFQRTLISPQAGTQQRFQHFSNGMTITPVRHINSGHTGISRNRSLQKQITPLFRLYVLVSNLKVRRERRIGRIITQQACR